MIYMAFGNGKTAKNETYTDLPGADRTSPKGSTVKVRRGNTDGLLYANIGGKDAHGKSKWVGMSADAWDFVMEASDALRDALNAANVELHKVRAMEALKAQYDAEMGELNAARKFLDDAKFLENVQSIKAKYPALFPPTVATA